MTEKSKEYFSGLFSENDGSLFGTDPEFTDFFSRFAFDEVPNQDDLDTHTRTLAILAALIGCQGVELFRDMLPEAIDYKVTPVEVKEMIYQATAYLGISRVYPFLRAANKEFTDLGVKLPLPGQATITANDRVEAGEQLQVDIFGEQMKGFAESGPEESRHINKWLSGNCFGDYYTRTGLDQRQREMITFCFLAAQGGCEPQLISHAAANMRIGNDKAFLIKVISQCIPYIGYPRSLNALRCVSEAEKE